MSIYSYQALNSDGESVSGEVSAETVSAAITELERQGLVIQSIQQVEVEVGPEASLRHPHAASMLDERFEQVLRRRDVYIPALTAFTDEMPVGRWKRDVRKFVSALSEGMSAPELRRRHARWLPLLESGIASESSAQSLTHAIEQALREGESRRQFRYALAYSLTVFALAMVVLIAMCWFVVPVFASIFDDLDMSLPHATRLLVSFTDELRFQPIRFFVVTVGVGLIVLVLLRVWIHFALSTRWFGMFTAGNAANVNAMARFCGQLAELLSISIPLSEALRIAGQGCQHRHFERVAAELAQVAQGDAASIGDSRVAHNLPRNLIYALSAASDGGPSVPLLRELSRMYRDRVRERMDWTTGVITQFAMVALGAMVGFIVIALFLPLVKLISALS